MLTDEAAIVDGAVLDFGTRTLRVASGGKLTIGERTVTIACGRMELTTGSSVSIELAGSTPQGTRMGNLIVETRCAGLCSGGAGDIEIGGRITANASLPGSLILRSAADVTIGRQVTLGGQGTDGDGGTLTVEAQGRVAVDATVQVRGGGGGSGGSISFTAGSDFSSTEAIDVAGGEFDAGEITIDSRGNVELGNELVAQGIGGGGSGGEISVGALGNLTITGGTSLNRMVLSTSGQGPIDGFAGDGGEQIYVAIGDIQVSRFVRLSSDGASPDGFGGEISLTAGGEVRLEGQARARGQGRLGIGGDFEAEAGGDVTLGPDAEVDVTGGSDVVAGTVTIISGATVEIAGEVATSGLLAGRRGVDDVVTVEACTVDLLPGASLASAVVSGVIGLSGRDAVLFRSGSSVEADATGAVELRYSAAGDPPSVAGNVNPAPRLIADPALTVCPVCGNSVAEVPETCDDGNVSSGDGCSVDCQNEGCLAGTPGWPTALLCDDAKACTDDSCDTGASACRHDVNCNDGVECTTEGCNEAGECEIVARDSLCDDSDPCTVGLCGRVNGCVFRVSNAACDDGLFCTGTETCDAVLGCQSPTPVDCTSLDSVCSEWFCDEDADACNPLPVNERAACDDGSACTTEDLCTSGVCVGSMPSECDDGDVCTQDTCDDTFGCINAGAPQLACLTAQKVQVQFKENANDAKDQLKWQWKKGAALVQEDLGDPMKATVYTLCVYDTAQGLARLAMSVVLAPNGRWQNKSPKGWQYKDNAGTQDGVSQLQLKTGADGKTRARLKAKGINLTMPVPVDADRYFDQDPSVAVQLVSDEGFCLTTDHSISKQNDAGQFKAN